MVNSTDRDDSIRSILKSVEVADVVRSVTIDALDRWVGEEIVLSDALRAVTKKIQTAVSGGVLNAGSISAQVANITATLQGSVAVNAQGSLVVSATAVSLTGQVIAPTVALGVISADLSKVIASVVGEVFTGEGTISATIGATEADILGAVLNDAEIQSTINQTAVDILAQALIDSTSGLNTGTTSANMSGGVIVNGASAETLQAVQNSMSGSVLVNGTFAQDTSATETALSGTVASPATHLIHPDEVEVMLTSSLGSTDQVWTGYYSELEFTRGNSASASSDDPTIVTTANEEHLSFDGGDRIMSNLASDPSWVNDAHKAGGHFTSVFAVRAPTTAATQLKRLVTNRSANAGFELFMRMNNTGSFMRVTREMEAGGSNFTLTSTNFTFTPGNDYIIGISFDVDDMKATFFVSDSTLLEEKSASFTYPATSSDPEYEMVMMNTVTGAGQMASGFRLYDAMFTDTYIPSSDSSGWSDIETNMAGLKTGITF